MPEGMRLLVRGGEMTSGFWIRRVAVVPARPTRQVRAEDNKENEPPEGLVGPTQRRRSQRTRKIPLPEWYPRTPLRDITAIVNALERRRLRVQAARATAGNRDSEASPENPPSSPLPQELSVADQTPVTDSTSNHTTTCVTSGSPVEHPLLPTPSASSSSQTDHSPINMKQIEIEEKLCRSIDQIEKIVKNNLKKTAKEAPPAKRGVMQRRTLMSMR